MTALTGQQSAVYVDQYDLSAYLNKFASKMSAKVLDTTTFGSTSKTKIGGIKDGSLSASGLYDNSAAGPDQVLPDYVGNDTGAVVTMCLGARTAGSRVRVAKAKPNGYKLGDKADALIDVNCDFEVDGGVFAGDLVAAMQRVTLGTYTCPSIATGISTTDGGFVAIHVAAISSGVTVDSLVIQDSDDGITFAHLATVASNLNAVGGTLYEIATTTQVDRYLQLVSTLSGSSGSAGVQLAVALGRR